MHHWQHGIQEGRHLCSPKVDEAVVQKLPFIQPLNVPEREGDRVGRVLWVRENRNHFEVLGRFLLLAALAAPPPGFLILRTAQMGASSGGRTRRWPPKLAPALLANSPHKSGAKDLHVRHGIDVNRDGSRGHRTPDGIQSGLLPPRVVAIPFLPSYLSLLTCALSGPWPVHMFECYNTTG